MNRLRHEWDAAGAALKDFAWLAQVTELFGLPSSGRNLQGERFVGEGDRERVRFSDLAPNGHVQECRDD